MRLAEPDTRNTTAPADALHRILDTEDCGALLDILVDGVIIVGEGGRVRAANRAACELLGIEMPALGQPAQTLLAAVSADEMASPYDPAHPRRQEFVIRRTDGRTVLIVERVCRDSHGASCYTLLMLRDLQLLDHQRRSASGLRGGNVFKFLSDRDSDPDFDVQRRLSPKLDQAIGRGARALRQGAHLLLIGESGSGKTELARQLHRSVGAPEDPFVHVNCAAIPETLFESEMFGYEKGAFTGALHGGKRGLLEGADGGTLFLDEVSEIPLPLQAKLLKFLEDGEVQRVGGQQAHAVRTRIVSASNQDLWKLVDRGLFRADLYYRLAVITVPVAPLREQPALLSHLIDYFVDGANRIRTPRLRLSAPCRALMQHYLFPGNVRELHNVIQHLSVVADEQARIEDLPEFMHSDERPAATSTTGGESVSARSAVRTTAPATAQPHTAPLRERVRAFERALIEHAISEHGSKRKAAHALGVDIGTVVRKTRARTSDTRPETRSSPESTHE